MLKVIPSIPEHFAKLEIQEAQSFFKENFQANPEYGEALIKYGICRTGVDENGTVIGIMGLTFRHNNCAEAWALFSPYIKYHIKSIVKEVKSFLKEHQYIKRIHCTAAITYLEANKLLEVFGFKLEGVLEKWDALGIDHLMYTIINNDLDWETK